VPFIDALKARIELTDSGKTYLTRMLPPKNRARKLTKQISRLAAVFADNLVLILPHWENIRYELERAFTANYQSNL